MSWLAFPRTPLILFSPIKPSPPDGHTEHGHLLMATGWWPVNQNFSAWLHTFAGRWLWLSHMYNDVTPHCLFFVLCHSMLSLVPPLLLLYSEVFPTHPPTLYCFNIFLPQALQRHNYARCFLKNRNLILLWRWKNLCSEKKPDSSYWRWKGVACFCSTPISKIKLETDYLRWKCQFSFWPQNIFLGLKGRLSVQLG